MAFYTIGDVAQRCGINPVTLRAWQRRYGLLKPQRSEGGHRQFDDEDILRIEEIKRLIESGVTVSKVKALLEDKKIVVNNGWETHQEAMMTLLRHVNPTRLRNAIMTLGREYPVDALLDNIIIPVRQRLTLDHNTARIMCSLLDGALLDYAITRISGARKNAGKSTLLIGWGTDDRTRLWLEAWRLAERGWHPDVFAEPLDAPRPELFPGQHIFVWTGAPLARRQQEQLTHWHEQGYDIEFHSP
nr:MerR family transcriptional regulator [uncultured Enterobacter sp.]